MTIPITPAPLEIFLTWLKDAEATEPNDPTAACLATTDTDLMPNARMVLVRIMDEKGFVFFTNSTSAKGRELEANKKAALCFHWKTQRKQVRIQGIVEHATETESDAYFNGRPRDSRIGAWASLQSQALPDRSVLLDRVKQFEHQFAGQDHPPRPPHWYGYRIVPQRVEFWKDGEFRLHERLLYIKNGDKWETTLLYP